MVMISLMFAVYLLAGKYMFYIHNKYNFFALIMQNHSTALSQILWKGGN